MLGTIRCRIEGCALEVVRGVYTELREQIVERLVAGRAESEQPEPPEYRSDLSRVLHQIDVELEAGKMPREVVGPDEQHALLPPMAADDARSVLMHDARHDVRKLALGSRELDGWQSCNDLIVHSRIRVVKLTNLDKSRVTPCAWSVIL